MITRDERMAMSEDAFDGMIAGLTAYELTLVAAVFGVSLEDDDATRGKPHQTGG